MTEMKDENANKAESSTEPPVESRVEQFSKTAGAAKMSGAFHETAGYVKRKLGELTDDSLLENAGRNEQILGKIHRLVGSLRGVREAALDTLNKKRIETQAICRKHGGRMLDVTSDFVDDLKKTLLK